MSSSSGVSLAQALRPSRNSLRVVFGLGRHNVKTPLVVKPEVLSLCEKLELSVRPPAEDEGSVQVQARSFTPRLNAELQKLLSEPELKRHFGSLPSTLEDELFQTAELALELPEALGPSSLSFASAPFWALALCRHRRCAQALLAPLVRPEALEVSKAAPPWLPFVAFANVMAAKDEQGEFFWRNETSRALLERFAERHLRFV
eukprot:g25720.t1